MSLLKLASLQSVESFWRNTEAISSFVVVLPFEPPTAITGNVKSWRYSAAKRARAWRVSSTAMTAQVNGGQAAVAGSRQRLRRLYPLPP